jgi:hypothetical protein
MIRGTNKSALESTVTVRKDGVLKANGVRNIVAYESSRGTIHRRALGAHPSDFDGVILSTTCEYLTRS